MREDSQRAAPHPPGMPPLDPANILRASTIRYGAFRARGVPAILIGFSTVVVAAGSMRALRAAAPALADVLREAKSLIETRADRRRLGP